MRLGWDGGQLRRSFGAELRGGCPVEGDAGTERRAATPTAPATAASILASWGRCQGSGSCLRFHGTAALGCCGLRWWQELSSDARWRGGARRVCRHDGSPGRGSGPGGRLCACRWRQGRQTEQLRRHLPHGPPRLQPRSRRGRWRAASRGGRRPRDRLPPREQRVGLRLQATRGRDLDRRGPRLVPGVGFRELLMRGGVHFDRQCKALNGIQPQLDGRQNAQTIPGDRSR
mmetsp:Transcript_57382/g.145516  ORF Transcript_57382/g.145516 Transcript_57382/m.145516 type:complete len:230 (-) Transcript_57382:90-779(-)